MAGYAIFWALTPKYIHLVPIVFPVPPGKEVGVVVQTIGVIYQKRLKIEIELLMSAIRKSYTL